MGFYVWALVGVLAVLAATVIVLMRRGPSTAGRKAPPARTPAVATSPQGKVVPRGPAADLDWDILRAIVGSMSGALICVDASGRIILINSAAEKLTGRSREEALGRPVQDVFKAVTEETRNPAENLVEKLSATASRASSPASPR